MTTRTHTGGFGRLYAFGALFAIEAVAMVVLFQIFSDLDCRETGYLLACRGLRGVMVHALCVFAGVVILLALRSDLRHALSSGMRRRDGDGDGRDKVWPLLHVGGLLLIVLPRLLSDSGQLNQVFPLLFAGLLGGGALAGVSALFWMMPPRAWRQWLQSAPASIGAVVLIALLTPTLATIINPLWWSMTFLVWGTFYGVAIVLGTLGNQVAMDPTREVIGTGDFLVQVADTCSGIEGLALTTAFMGIYAVLMRGDLRQGRFWLFVWPGALIMSFLFNILRISGLILIGANVSPELAVNGFHSFAGWLAFTVLSLGILFIVQAVPGLMKQERGRRDTDLPPITEDRAAAFILPFLLFMLAGLVVNTFYSEPALGYPIQAAAMLLGLVWLRKPFLALDWRLDPLAMASGVVIGVGWVLTTEASAPIAGLAEVGGVTFALWVIVRILGTSLLVPVVEEAFFRGYLLNLIDDGTVLRRVLAVGVTTAAFAALHGRLLEAGLAGLIFALLVLRSGRVTDAIVAHAVANALIAAVAFAKGDWLLI